MSSSTPVDMEISDGSDTNSDMDVSDSDQEVEQIVTYSSSSSSVAPFTNQHAVASASYVTAGADFNARSYAPYADQGAVAKQTPINTFYPGHDAVSAPAVGIPSYNYSNGYGVQPSYMELPHHTLHFNPHIGSQPAIGGFGNRFEPGAELLPEDFSMKSSSAPLAEDTLSESGYHTAPDSPMIDTEDEEPGLIKSEDDELEGLKAQLERYQRQIEDFDKEIEVINKDKRRLEREFLRLRVQHSMVQNRKKAKGPIEATPAAKKEPLPSKTPAINSTNHLRSSVQDQESTQQISSSLQARPLSSRSISAPSSSTPLTADTKRTLVTNLSPSSRPKTPTILPLPHRRNVWTNPHIGKKDPPAATTGAAPSLSKPKATLFGSGTQRLAGATYTRPSAPNSDISGVQIPKKLVVPDTLPAKNQQQPKQPTTYQNNQIPRSGSEPSRPSSSSGAPSHISSQPKKTALSSEKNGFRPYDSPLRRLGISKAHPYNQQLRPAIPNENLTREMCRFEIAGTCNDDTCNALHFRDFEGTMSQ
ncbi:hypothetical protein BX666DRAFT_1973772 [Dichotomocladium elegans]|nr:hypothetical protein BX666DRAFT_1973772 [Dichotomocladium elegans]